MPSAVLVHPDESEVFLFALEPIMQQDGQSRIDCECTAAVRLFNILRHEHPHVGFVVVADQIEESVCGRVMAHAVHLLKKEQKENVC